MLVSPTFLILWILEWGFSSGFIKLRVRDELVLTNHFFNTKNTSSTYFSCNQYHCFPIFQYRQALMIKSMMCAPQLRTGIQNISYIKPAPKRKNVSQLLIVVSVRTYLTLYSFEGCQMSFFLQNLFDRWSPMGGGWALQQLIFNFATSADHRHQLPLLLLIISLWTFVFILWRPTLMHSGAFFVFLESRNKFWIMAGHLYHAFVSVKISNWFALWEFVIVGCRVAVFCIIGTTCTIVTQCQTVIIMVMVMLSK